MKFKKIGIIHLNQIGDLVFSLPLLKAIKDNYPDSEVHSIVRPRLRDLLADSPDVDKLIDRTGGLMNTFRLLKEIRRNRYDLLITLSNSGAGLFLTTFSRAGIKAGFVAPPWDLKLDIKEKIEGHHSWRHNIKLLKSLGMAVKKNDYVGLLVLPPKKNFNDLAGTESFDLSKKYAVISPGTSARRTVKAWGNEKFAELIIRLKKNYDFNPVLVGGPENREANEQIIKIIKEKKDGPPRSNRGQVVDRILDLTGRINLKNLCYVLQKAGLFVGVDSGIMHLASSFDIPVVGIFGPTDPFYVGPLNDRSVVVQKKEMECVPCYLKGCPERECMAKITAEEVFDACTRVLPELKTQVSS